MRRAFFAFLSTALLLIGCRHSEPPPEHPFSHYSAPQFQWAGVARVLILPLDNETAFPHVADEVRNALATEMQRMGVFEVVPAPPEVPAELCRVIRENGRFNEVALVQLARAFRADVIVLGSVTQYSPYTLPRLGMVLQVVSPGDGAVVASIDGVWDAASRPIADRARGYYRQYFRPREQPFTSELVLDSPRLYQRYVCCEAVHVLLSPNDPPGDIGAAVAPGPAIPPPAPVHQLPPPRPLPIGEAERVPLAPIPVPR